MANIEFNYLIKMPWTRSYYLKGAYNIKHVCKQTQLKAQQKSSL